MTALILSPLFDFRQTYFLISGIAGVNPNQGTLADVTFAKYAIQIGLQYEFDAREVPNQWNTGYAPLGANRPDMYPTATYGSEVFELNAELRDAAATFASAAKLNDSLDSVIYRSNYNLATSTKVTSKYKQAIRKPSVIKCDVVTSDVYFSGTLLGQSVENTTRLFTNGSATYCMTAQEDNATLEALLRGAANKLLDFSRIIVMRSAADFDRPYPGISCYDNLFIVVQGAFGPSLMNLYLAGAPVVKGILNEWSQRFQAGIKPSNYIGDIFGTLGGIPDFGPGNGTFGNNPVQERALGAEKTAAENPKGKGKWGYRAAVKAQGSVS
jgi:purine nucleoside permease